LVRTGEEFGQTEICEFDVPVFLQQHILRFKISMHDFVFMENTNGENELGRVKLGLSFSESFDLEEILVHVSSSDEFKEEVDSEIILEDIIHAKEEGMVGLEENVSFIIGVLDLALLDENILSDSLHSIKTSCGLHLNEEHLTEGSFVDYFEDLKVIEAYG